MLNKIKLLLGGKGASTGATYLIFVRLVTILLGFIVSRILSQYLTKFDYGTYSQVMLVVSTVVSITILGMADAVNFFFCREKDEEIREKFVSTIFSMQYIVGIIASAVLIILAVPLCKYFKNESLKPLIYISAIMPLFQNLVAMLQVLFISIGKSKSIALRNLLCSILKLFVVWIACVFVESIAVIILATLLMDLSQYILFYIILNKNNCKIKITKTDFNLVKPILAYSIPMAAFTVISAFSRDMDKYVISTFMDTESLAVYSNAAKILPFDIIMASFITVLLPYITSFIASKRYEEVVNLYKKFLQLTYITTTIMAVAVLICAPEFINLLYTEKYLEGLGVFCIYILVDIVRFATITLVLSAAGKTKTIMWISVGSLALNFVINLLLYFLFGFEGPAIATLIVTLVMGALMLYYSAKELGTSIFNFFDFKHITVFFSECIIIGIICSVLRKLLVNFNLNYLLVIVVVSGLFGIIMLALNIKKIFAVMKEIEATKLELPSQ